MYILFVMNICCSTIDWTTNSHLYYLQGTYSTVSHWLKVFLAGIRHCTKLAVINPQTLLLPTFAKSHIPL